MQKLAIDTRLYHAEFDLGEPENGYYKGIQAAKGIGDDWWRKDGENMYTMINSFGFKKSVNRQPVEDLKCTKIKTVCTFRLCSFYERVRFELYKHTLKVQEPHKYEEFQALPDYSFFNERGQWDERGAYWHYPCGNTDRHMPVYVTCNFECEFTPAVRASELLYEF